MSDAPSMTILEFIDARLDTMLAHPGNWGSPEAFEMQALLLIELRQQLAGQPWESLLVSQEAYVKFTQERYPDHPPAPLSSSQLLELEEYDALQELAGHLSAFRSRFRAREEANLPAPAPPEQSIFHAPGRPVQREEANVERVGDMYVLSDPKTGITLGTVSVEAFEACAKVVRRPHEEDLADRHVYRYIGARRGPLCEAHRAQRAAQGPILVAAVQATEPCVIESPSHAGFTGERVLVSIPLLAGDWILTAITEHTTGWCGVEDCCQTTVHAGDKFFCKPDLFSRTFVREAKLDESS